MRDHRQRRDEAQAGFGQEGRGDEHAVAEVVDAVAHQHAPAAAPGLLLVEAMVVVVAVALVVMAVPVQLGLLQQEEEHQAAQQREEQLVRVGVAFKRLRQHVQQGRSQ